MTTTIKHLQGTLKGKLDPAIQATCTLWVEAKELEANGVVVDRTLIPHHNFIRDVRPTLQAGDYELSWSGPMIGQRPSPRVMPLTSGGHWVDPQAM